MWLIVGQLPIKAWWRDPSLALGDFSQSNKHCIHLSTTKTIYYSRFVFAISAFAPIKIFYSNMDRGSQWEVFCKEDVFFAGSPYCGHLVVGWFFRDEKVIVTGDCFPGHFKRGNNRNSGVLVLETLKRREIQLSNRIPQFSRPL